MRIAAAILALALCGAPPTLAEPPSVARADILWAGLYEAEISGTIPQPDTAIGRTNELADTRKLKATTTIDGRLGISFGLEYALVGKPAGADVPISIVVILPREGLHNPARSERTYREQWLPSLKTIGGTSIVGYTFEHAWEVVPGLWTFEIWSGDQKLGEQAFCVLTERPAPKPGEDQPREPCRSVPTV